jgi:hypothetical protein
VLSASPLVSNSTGELTGDMYYQQLLTPINLPHGVLSITHISDIVLCLKKVFQVPDFHLWNATSCDIYRLINTPINRTASPTPGPNGTLSQKKRI